MHNEERCIKSNLGKSSLLSGINPALRGGQLEIPLVAPGTGALSAGYFVAAKVRRCAQNTQHGAVVYSVSGSASLHVVPSLTFVTEL